MLQALIFDVDGTLADTESMHRSAFNAAFAKAGLDWYWSESLYIQLLDVAGGKERIAHYWKMVDPAGASAKEAYIFINNVHALKTCIYEDLVGDGGLPLRPGIQRLVQEAAAAGMPMAIATTTTPANVDALLRIPFGADWRTLFAAICDGGTTAKKKPAPDVYLDALRGLGLPAQACLAFEDSANGLRAATAVGIPTVATPTAYTALHDLGDALLVLPHLGDPGQPLKYAIPGTRQRWVDLQVLARWHESALSGVN